VRSIDPFSAAGLAQAIGQVTAETGPGPRLTHVLINDAQVQFSVLGGGKKVKAYSVLSDGSLATSDVTVTITGTATIDDFSFGIGVVQPQAIDRMLARAKKLSGAADFRPSTLNLQRDLTNGVKPPEWQINAEGNGHYLTFRADSGGRHLRNVGGKGVQIPQAAIDARKLNDCIQSANQDFDEIESCFDEFSP
jgi:hypothetical protein